jgi:hypothetical protein
VKIYRYLLAHLTPHLRPAPPFRPLPRSASVALGSNYLAVSPYGSSYGIDDRYFLIYQRFSADNCERQRRSKK